MNDHASELLRSLSQEAGFELSEADLLQAVEGIDLGVHPARLAAAEERSARIGSLVSRLRADRAAMAASAQEIAPDSLIDGIQLRLERESLLAAEESAPAPIPISQVTVCRPSAWERVVGAAPWRKLAVAAGLLVVVSVSVWAITRSASAWRDLRGGLARHDAANNTHETLAPENAKPDRTAIASNDPRPNAVEPLVNENPATAVAAAIPTDIDEAAAVRLAAEHRLVIVVTGSQSDAPRRISALVSDAAPDHAMSCSVYAAAAVPAEYAFLTVPWQDPTARPHPRDPRMLEPTVVVKDTAPGAFSPNGAPVDAPKPTIAPAQPTVLAICAADVADLERDLPTLLSALRGKHGQNVRLRALDTPVAAPLKLDAESVLWWAGAPSKWSRTTSVPIVVESNR